MKLKPKYKGAGVSLLFILTISACDSEEKARAKAEEEWAGRTVVRNVVTALPESLVADTVVVSDDGSNYAYAIKAGDGQRIVHNGDEQIVYDRVSKPRFGPFSNKLFYWALVQSRSEEGVLLIADGREISTGLNGEGSMYFSPDGSRWAVVGATETGPITLIVDGQITREHSDLSRPAFSNDGEHMAILVPGALVVDNDTVTEFPESEVDISMEVAVYSSGPNMPPLHKVMYLSNGSLLFITKESKGWTVFMDDTRLASYTNNIWGGGALRIMSFEGFDDAASILPSSLNTAADAPYAIWWERPEGTDQLWRVVRNGIPLDSIVSSRFWDDQKPVLSDDGERWAYPAYINDETGSERIFLIVDGDKYGPYAHVWGVTFSGDSGTFAYAASNGEDEAPWTYYLDGEALPGRYDSPWQIQLSHYGNHHAWRAERNVDVVVIDGAEEYGGEAPLTGPVFLGEAALRKDTGSQELMPDNAEDRAQSVSPRVVWHTIEEGNLVQYIR